MGQGGGEEARLAEADHAVDSAIQFFVTSSNPGKASFDFRQDAGLGAVAFRPTTPVQMKRLAGSTTPDPESVERIKPQ